VGRNARRALRFLGPAVIVVLAALWALNAAPAAKVIVVRPTVVVTRVAAPVLTATGYLASREQAAVGAKVSGRVQRILVEEGQRVKDGDVLAILDHDDLEAALAVARAAVSRSRAEVKAGEATFAEEDRDLVRKRALYRSGVASRTDFETADAQRDASAARLEALRQAVAVAEAEVQVAEARRQNMIVRAPFAGTVISKDAQVGETITTGGMGAASGRGSIVTLADLSRLEVEADIKEDFIGRVQRGQPAVVVVDALPGREYRARLRHIIPMGDRSRAIIRVRVEIEEPGEGLFPEMSATVQFMAADGAQESRPQRHLLVPKQALWEGDGGSALWVVRAGRTRKVPMQDVRLQGDSVYADSVLDESDLVIIDPAMDLREDRAVTARVRE